MTPLMYDSNVIRCDWRPRRWGHYFEWMSMEEWLQYSEFSL